MSTSPRPTAAGPCNHALVRQLLRLLAIALACSACAAPPPVKPPVVVLFDEGHGERFSTEKTGELDLSQLAGLMRAQGAAVRVNREPLDAARLSGVNALVISGAFSPLTAAEGQALLSFLDRGGKLCVMLHVAQPMGDFLHALDVSISNGVIREREHVVDDDALSFQVVTLAPHELTRQVSAFTVHGAWALLNTAQDGAPTAVTSPTAWVDLNADQTLGEGDAVQAFGVMVTGQRGKGQFAVFGDDAIFQNRFLTEGNLVLAKNLSGWLGQPTLLAAN